MFKIHLETVLVFAITQTTHRQVKTWKQSCYSVHVWTRNLQPTITVAISVDSWSSQYWYFSEVCQSERQSDLSPYGKRRGTRLQSLSPIHHPQVSRFWPQSIMPPQEVLENLRAIGFALSVEKPITGMYGVHTSSFPRLIIYDSEPWAAWEGLCP